MTERHWARIGTIGAALAAGSILAGGCGSGITPPPLQHSISQAFSNLYLIQQVDQGYAKPALASLHTSANCQKGTQSSPQSGAGDDWVCYVTYLVAGPNTPVTATYNVNVQTDGCYAADGDGPASLNGSRTITGPGQRQVVNPLWLIDGCFDVS